MQNLNRRYASYHVSRRSNRLPKSLIRLGILLLIIFIGWYFLRSSGGSTANFFTDTVAKVVPSPSPNQDSALAALIQPLIPTDNGDYAIVIRSLADDQHNYFYQSNRTFPSASLYKLFLLSSAYRQITDGKLALDSTVSGNTDDLITRLGGVENGYQDVSGSISDTVEDCLDRIARLSDNYCALMVADKIGWDTIQQEAGILGASHTSIKSPITTSPEDISSYFNQLYHGQIVDATASAKIVDLLATNFNNNRIPALLPEKLKIAHKTGELGGVRHDAGIVYLPGHPYLIVMMSENLNYEDDAADSMAQISKTVYDYFSQLAMNSPSP